MGRGETLCVLMTVHCHTGLSGLESETGLWSALSWLTGSLVHLACTEASWGDKVKFSGEGLKASPSSPFAPSSQNCGQSTCQRAKIKYSLSVFVCDEADGLRCSLEPVHVSSEANKHSYGNAGIFARSFFHCSKHVTLDGSWIARISTQKSCSSVLQDSNAVFSVVLKMSLDSLTSLISFG